MTPCFRFAVVLLAIALIPTASGDEPKGDAKQPFVPDIQTTKKADVLAMVNGEPISREQLAEELIETYGKQHLDTMIHRKLIAQACRENSVTVTKEDVEVDIQETLTRLNMSRKELQEHVLSTFKMSFAQHVRDNIYPKLAMRKLVEGKIQVTEDDLKRGFEATYGAKVDVRMLVVYEMRKATEMWQLLQDEKEPEKRIALFEELAKEHSIDQATRPYGGRCQPINMHSSNPELEKKIFALKEGELTEVMQVANGHMFFICVNHLPPVEGVTMETVRNKLTGQTVRQELQEAIHTMKMRSESEKLFLALREKARIENYLSGDFDPETLKTATAPEAEDKVKR